MRSDQWWSRGVGGKWRVHVDCGEWTGHPVLEEKRPPGAGWAAVCLPFEAQGEQDAGATGEAGSDGDETRRKEDGVKLPLLGFAER